MRFLRKSSIQRKLAVVVLCASCLGLSVTCLGFALYERSSYRAAMTSELSTLADTLGANMAASLVLEDRQSARDTLAALRAEPHVVAACLYDRQGEMFAEYRREVVGPECQMSSWQADGAEFEPQSVTLYRSVLLPGKKVSTIAIVSDLSGLHAKMREYTKISIIVLLTSVLAIWPVSSRLLRRLTEPILQLAGIAERVSAEENYALRAIPKSNDAHFVFQSDAGSHSGTRHGVAGSLRRFGSSRSSRDPRVAAGGRRACSRRGGAYRRAKSPARLD